MKRSPSQLLFVTSSAALIVLVILGTVRIVNPRSLAERPLSGRELLDQVIGLVDERYIRPVDVREKIWFDAIRGVVEGLDPYSRFYTPDEKAGFEEETEGKFGGIGVSIWISVAGDLIVNFPILGGPASSAGVRPCDRIVGVDGEPIGPILDRDDRAAVIERLRGAPGTPVTLSLVRDETPLEVTLVRDSIAHRSVVGIDVLDAEHRIGYLHVKGFQETTTQEFDEAMRTLLEERGIRSLVLDLRFNPGGILKSAVELADRFLRSGTIVFTRGRTARADKEYVASAENTLPDDLALVVLINGESASASEVAAGALQDHRRAILVGEPTYGKGVVQNVLYLNGERTILKITSAAYFTPSGRCIESRIPVPGADPDAIGILPDFAVADPEPRGTTLELHLARSRPGEDYDPDIGPCFPEENDGFEDPQLEAALDLLRGKPLTEPVARSAVRTDDGSASGAAEVGEAVRIEESEEGDGGDEDPNR